MGNRLKNKILIISFNLEPWVLSTTIEILNKEIDEGKKVDWCNFDNLIKRKTQYPFSNTINSHRLNKLLIKINADLNFTYYDKSKFKPRRLTISNSKITDKIYNRAKTIAYWELVSELRDSSPCLKHNDKQYKHYAHIYLETHKIIDQILKTYDYKKVYVYNGRTLQERAVWDACLENNIAINFYESFNKNWTNRYFIFKKPTHSPRYRSNIMLNFSKINDENKNMRHYNLISKKWFTDRQNGLSQNFTKLQNRASKIHFKKPYFVFFHSSQDELDMLGLVSKYWKDQMNALSTVVDIFNNDQKYDLVLRLHPHLLHKSRIEIAYWNKIGSNLANQFSWFHFVTADNEIDSYQLIKNSSGVITCASTIGVEASYLKKKSILIGRAFHEYMGITQNPKNKKELIKLLNTPIDYHNIQKSYDNALSYGFFNEKGGIQYKYVKLIQKNKKDYYVYKGKILNPLLIVRVLRVIEESANDMIKSIKQWRCLNDCGFNSRTRWQ